MTIDEMRRDICPDCILTKMNECNQTDQEVKDCLIDRSYKF